MQECSTMQPLYYATDLDTETKQSIGRDDTSKNASSTVPDCPPGYSFCFQLIWAKCVLCTWWLHTERCGQHYLDSGDCRVQFLKIVLNNIWSPLYPLYLWGHYPSESDHVHEWLGLKYTYGEATSAWWEFLLNILLRLLSFPLFTFK